MNICALDLPPDRSEIDAAGLTLLPGIDIAVPRIAEAPFALECRRSLSLAFGPQRELLIGEVLRLHARVGLIDPVRLRVTDEYRPVGRLFGDGYARQRDRFALKRETYAEWLARREPQP
jgi:flavin reductase (DIM6/NTAB) family NADH-FMN oxidoreductase RutF